MAEAHESAHKRKLPGVVELEARNAFSCRGDRWLGQHSQLAAVHEGFYDVLLDVAIVVVDRRERAAQGGQVFDGFLDAVNSQCWQPASSRSSVVKNGVKQASHFSPQAMRSRGVNESANFCSRSGLAQRMNAFERR